MKLNFRLQNLLMTCILLTPGLSCDDDDDDGNGMTDMHTVTLDLVTDGLASPTVMVESPDNSGRLFIADQSGEVLIIKDGTKLSTPFLDISDKVIPRQSPQDERGLLGLTFHPEFASNGRFFVYYSGPLSPSGPEGWDHTNFVAEYTVQMQVPRAQGRSIKSMRPSSKR